MTETLPELLPCFYCGAEVVIENHGFVQCFTITNDVFCFSGRSFLTDKEAIESHNFIAQAVKDAREKLKPKWEVYWKDDVVVIFKIYKDNDFTYDAIALQKELPLLWIEENLGIKTTAEFYRLMGEKKNDDH